MAYAARRAKNSNGGLVLLFVIDDSDFQQILGVADIMRAEAEERARSSLEKIAANVREKQGLEPELIIREGRTVDELLQLVDADQDIAILVLAAGTYKEGPGPLVQSLAGRAQFPLPVTVIPTALSDEDIDAVT